MVKFQEDKTTTSENVSEVKKSTGDEFVVHNTLIDYHEPNGYASDEKTIFAYTETRRFYM